MQTTKKVKITMVDTKIEESEYWFCPKCGVYAGELISITICDNCGSELSHSHDEYE